MKRGIKKAKCPNCGKKVRVIALKKQKIDLLIIEIGVFEAVYVLRTNEECVASWKIVKLSVYCVRYFSASYNEKLPVVVIVQGVEIGICPGERYIAVSPGGRTQKIRRVHFIVFRYGNVRKNRFFKRIHNRIIAYGSRRVN